MTWSRWLIAGALALVVSAGAQAEAQKPPFAGDPDEAVQKPRPPVRTWTVNAGGFSYSFEFTPGIPKAGELIEIMISVARIPTTPHPRFGTRIPQEDARLVLEVTAPDAKRLRRFRAHAIPRARGRYGLHVTALKDGLHGLRIVGRAKDGAELRAETKLPVNVWPLPPELEGSGDEAGSTRRRRPVIVPQ